METVSLFVTCLVDMFRPEAGKAAVRVLERRGCQVNFPSGQTCCGQFSYNTGYQHEAALLARHWIEVFESTKGPVVALSGSCAAMAVRTYPDLVHDDAIAQGGTTTEAEAWRRRAMAVSDRVWELTQWLLHVAGEHLEEGGEAEPSVPMLYHLGCHMRRVLRATTEAQAVMAQSGIQLMEPDDEDQCCGFGGTYSLVEPKVSTALADAKWDRLYDKARETGAWALTSADLGCLLHLQGRASRLGGKLSSLYLAEILDLRDQERLTAENLTKAGGN